jgi:acetylornithine deacetylase
VPPLLTPAGSPLAALLAPYANDGPEAATFATDGGHLAAAGASPLVFGPGDIAVAHKADEWVAPGDLHRAADLVEAAIQRRCTGVGRQS